MRQSSGIATVGKDAPKRGRRWWLFPALFIPASFVATCWWLTEPQEDLPVEAATANPGAAAGVVDAPSPPPLTWPADRLEGRAAKELLLGILEGAAGRLDSVDSYTATLRKQERINGALSPVQTVDLKVKHRPFSVYMKFVSPQAGKEVVYAEGRHENKMIAHGAGLARRLVPRLALAPDHPLALADSRHAITEAGLANLTKRLIGFRKLDLTDPDSETVLDRTTDAAGLTRLRSVHTHTVYHEDRPFARIEVLYDVETRIPVDIRNFDWPDAGKSAAHGLLLAEHYSYNDLNLDVALTALDFDPANPNYEFHRY